MKRLAFLLFGLCMAGGQLRAEENDFGLWTFLGAGKKISKTVSLYTEAELRTRDNVGTVDCWSLYGEISVRICPWLKGGGGYTYIDYNSPDVSWESRHRLNLFLTGSYSTGGWYFAVRERYEQLHRILTEKSRPNPTAKRTLRSRFECSYQIPKTVFTPYGTIELYTSLNTSQGVKNDKIRYTLGTSIRVTGQHAFSIYYRYVDLVQRTASDSHILGAGFRFNF